MYKTNKPNRTSIRCNESTEGERLEEKIERILNNKEPIRDTAPVMYLDRADGILPQYDIRTDKWEQMTENQDKLAEASLAIRESKKDSKIIELDPKTGKKKETIEVKTTTPIENQSGK